MKAEARLTVDLADAKSREALAEVLAPDNEGLPGGLRMSVAGAGRSLRYRIVSDSPSSAVSTALALLRDVSLFQEVWLLSRSGGA